MKKILTVLLSLIMAIGCFSLFSGCNGGSGEKDDPNKTNITLWCQIPQYEYFSELEAMFEAANPDINLKVVAQAENKLGLELDASLSSSNAPDIFSTYGGLVAGTLNRSKHLLDLSDVMNPIEDKLVDAAKTNKIDGDGKYVSIPLNGFASPVIFYNKTEFEKLKTDSRLNATQKATIKIPNTYAELKALCDSISSIDLRTITAGLSTWHMPHLMQALHSRSMTDAEYDALITRDNEVNPFRVQNYAKGFELLKRYIDDGVLTKGAQSHSVDDADTFFYNEKALMRLGVSLDFKTLNETALFDLGAFFLPQEEGNSAPRANALYADVLAARKTTKFPEAVKKALAFIMSKDAQDLLAKYSLFSSRTDADLTDLPEPLKPIMDEIQKGSNDFYQSWSFAGIDVKLLNASSDYLSGSISSQGAANMIANYYDDGYKQLFDKFPINRP